jgi:hypothetical protein
MFRKEDFDARAGGFRGFDEDEFVFVGQDHWDSAGNLPTRRVFGKLPKTTGWQPALPRIARS